MRIALLAVLLAIPVEAAEPLPRPDLVCDGNWCAIRIGTLKTLIDGLRAMGERQEQLETLCGWQK